MNVLRQVAEEKSENPNISSTPSLRAINNDTGREEKFADRPSRIITMRVEKIPDHLPPTKDTHLPVWVDVFDQNV